VGDEVGCRIEDTWTSTLQCESRGGTNMVRRGQMCGYRGNGSGQKEKAGKSGAKETKKARKAGTFIIMKLEESERTG